MFTFTVDDQIELRPIRLTEADAHYALLDAERLHIGQWEDWVHTTTLESQRDFIRRKGQQYTEGRGFAAGVYFRETPTEDYDLVGNIGGEISALWRTLEIGYWLASGYVGRGIMTRCVKAVVDIAFTDWEINRVLIVVAVGNTASRAIPERLGFRLDGILRDDGQVRGRFFDRAYYSLLASEWARL